MHLSAIAEHLELIKRQAPPTEHPPLESKHPEINTTSLTLRVNSPEGKGHTVCRVHLKGINRYWKNEACKWRKKNLLGKNQAKRFQTVSFCLQPHARRWLPDVKGSCYFDWTLTCLKAAAAVAKNNLSFVRVNSNCEPCCRYIILDWVTTLRYSRHPAWLQGEACRLRTWQEKHTPQGRVETRTFSAGGLHYSNTGVPCNSRPWPASVHSCACACVTLHAHTY